jgi:hypothetical protein
MKRRLGGYHPILPRHKNVKVLGYSFIHKSSSQKDIMGFVLEEILLR